jgi:hypothetical protein
MFPSMLQLVHKVAEGGDVITSFQTLSAFIEGMSQDFNKETMLLNESCETNI